MTEEINNMINKFCDSVEKRISQYELEKENAELKSYSQRMENQRENYYKEYLRLEQENKVLQAYKDINEDFKKAWNELNEKYKQLHSALEKINRTLLGVRGLSINCDKQIIKVKAIVNEVLK